MKTEDLTDTLKAGFEKEILRVEKLGEKRLSVHINSDAIVNVARFLHVHLQLRFIIASAMHTKKGIEILYHFSDDSNGNITNIQVVLDEDKPEIESLTGVFTAADWIEREMHEILGINFLNHPNLEKLLSEGNWAEGVYPYRKDKK
ncbi:MAG: NADH-quinone oxidoreductase subunit C [Bacteroidales bacterium]